MECYIADTLGMDCQPGGGSGMLNYLHLRTTAKYLHKCVATNWVNLQTMWRIVPRLQAWLRGRCM